MHHILTEYKEAAHIQPKLTIC